MRRPPVNQQPQLKNAAVATDTIRFDLSDGRSMTFPLAWSSKLASATVEQRQNVTFTPYNAFWDDVDEIIDVENVLYGTKLYPPEKSQNFTDKSYLSKQATAQLGLLG